MMIKKIFKRIKKHSIKAKEELNLASKETEETSNWKFDVDRDTYEWTRYRLHLHTAQKTSDDYYLDIDTGEFFLLKDKVHPTEISIDQLPICYGFISESSVVLLGYGNISYCMRYTRESNGYPVGPWDSFPVDRVYYMESTGIRGFYEGTFRGLNSLHPEFIEYDLEKVRAEADKSYYQIQMSYDEFEAFCKKLITKE